MYSNTDFTNLRITNSTDLDIQLIHPLKVSAYEAMNISWNLRIPIECTDKAFFRIHDISIIYILI